MPRERTGVDMAFKATTAVDRNEATLADFHPLFQRRRLRQMVDRWYFSRSWRAHSSMWPCGPIPWARRLLYELSSVREISCIRITSNIQGLSLSSFSRTCRKENAISILIVDDTESIVHLLTHFLAGLPGEIEIARDGEEAVALVADAIESDKPYDVVLMDLHMPNKSGMQAAKEIRDRGIDVPLIAMTAGRYSAKDCTDAGFDGYVAKPFYREHLVELIGEFVR